MKKQKSLLTKLAISATIFLLIGAYFYFPSLTYLQGKYFARTHRGVSVLGLSIFRLPVVYHRQEHSLSCEIAALKMALSGVGVDISESELIQKLKFDPTPRTKGVWGDPYKGFVGNIDGKMGKTGYGVYWEPVHEVALQYANSEIIENATPQDLTKYLSEGKPIVWWGYFGRGKKISWQTPEGKQINAIDGEHARTLVGFAGSKEEPEGFFILDPIYGEMFWSTKELMDNSRPFGNSGLVVGE